MILAVLGGVILVLAIPAVRHWREQPPDPPQPVHASWTPAPDLALGAGLDHPFGLALGPDGRRLVFPATRGGEVALYLQELATGATAVLPGTVGAAMPFWSPDARRIGFFADGKLRALDLEAGIVVNLADAPRARGGAWSVSGDLVFAASDGGLTWRSADGSTRAFTTLDERAGDVAHRWPVFLADGRHVIFLARTRQGTHDGIRVVTVGDPSPPRPLVSTGAGAIVSGDRLVYTREDALVAQRIETGTIALVGPAALVGFPVGRGPLSQVFATAAADALMYGPPVSTARQVVRVSRNGTRGATVGGPADSWDLRIAPDGRRVAITQVDDQLRTLDVWIYDGARPLPARVSPSTDADESAAWSADGRRLAWVSARRDITVRGAGAVLPEQVLARVDPPARVTDWTRDGQWVIITRPAAVSRDDIWRVPAAGGDPVPVVRSAFNDGQGVVSPDGRWIAYASDEAGHLEVYIDHFPAPRDRRRVTFGGGADARWRRDGGELYFRRRSEIHAAALAAGGGGSIDVRSTARLFDAGQDLRSWDAAPDGRSFVVNLPVESAPSRVATLLLHWAGPK